MEPIGAGPMVRNWLDAEGVTDGARVLTAPLANLWSNEGEE